MKKRKTKFNTTLGVPVAQGFLCNGSPFNAIIDTGSEETLIDKDYIKENKKCFTLERTDYKINFMGIHGKKTHG